MNMWYNRRESNMPWGEKRMNTVRNDPRDFLDEPGVKTLCYWCRGLGLIPGQGTRSRVPQLRPEAAKKRKRSKKVSQRRRQWTECGKMSSIFLGCGEGKLKAFKAGRTPRAREQGVIHTFVKQKLGVASSSAVIRGNEEIRQRDRLEPVVKSPFFFEHWFYIGGQPVNSVVIDSGGQQRDSAIHTHASILP